MKQRPILFSTEMVRAILQNDKSQTRRIVKRKFPHGEPEGSTTYMGGWPVHFPDGKWDNEWCPYGQPGSQLWVRETWAQKIDGEYIYKADYQDGFKADYTATGRWKPSIYMPRAASRILLEITDVRCERLLSITEEDAIAEGVKKWPDGNYNAYGTHFGKYSEARNSYLSLWDYINGEGSHKQNPYVWVIEFKRI